MQTPLAKLLTKGATSFLQPFIVFPEGGGRPAVAGLQWGWGGRVGAHRTGYEMDNMHIASLHPPALDGDVCLADLHPFHPYTHNIHPGKKRVGPVQSCRSLQPGPGKVYGASFFFFSGRGGRATQVHNWGRGTPGGEGVCKKTLKRKIQVLVILVFLFLICRFLHSFVFLQTFLFNFFY